MAKSLFNSNSPAKAVTPVLTAASAQTPIERFYGVHEGNPDRVPDSELMLLVGECHRAYRLNPQPLMPDNLYDQLEARLLKIVPDALHRIEAAMTSEVYREKISLPHEMGGITQLNDVAADAETTDAEIHAYISLSRADEFDLSDKLDGNSCMLHYRNGRLCRAFSKHTGDEGLDITRNIVNMPSVPKTIALDGDVYVRGETIIPVEKFLARWAASTGAGEYANPRNFVSGKMGSKTPDIDALQDIEFVAYTLCDSDASSFDQIDELSKLGFIVARVRRFPARCFSKTFLDMHVEQTKQDSPYELDGVVIDPVLPEHDESLRRKYKIVSETATTVVKDVEWNLHKDGHFRPVAILEPVQLNGVTVSRASAFNAFYIQHGRLSWEDFKPDHPIGPGAVVTIIRSGDVIPDIQSVDVPAAEPKLPDVAVWGAYEWEEGDVWTVDEESRGIHLMTSNPDHPVIKFRNFNYFFSMIGVEGFRGGSIQKVLDTYPDASIKDICDFTEGDFHHAGFGDIQAKTIVENIKYALDGIYLPCLMAASNMFGRLWAFERCEKLYKHYEGNCLDWSGYTQDEIIDEIDEINGFGWSTASAFAKGIHRFNEFVEELGHLVKIAPYQEAQLASTKLQGWQVVFTGLRDNDLEDTIVANGGGLASWTKAMIIVAKDKSLIRPKIKAALDRGAKIYSKSEFVAMLEGALQ